MQTTSGDGKCKVEHEDVLPDFLEDSPFLPIWTHDDERAKIGTLGPKSPSITEVLKSKPARLAYCALLLLLLFTQARTARVYDRLTGPSCYFRDPVVPPRDWQWESLNVDWDRFAYALYATDAEHLCNAVVMFESLRQLGSSAQKLLLYADTMGVDEDSTREGRMLRKAQRELGVELQAVKVVHEDKADFSGPNWADSYTKLLAFNQTQYSRLIVLDSDALLLQPLDDLFFLPPAAAVMPQAYWLDTPTLSSHVMVLTPSTENSIAVGRAIDHKAGYGFYDMEIMNHAFGRTCLVLPYQQYALLTGEFRRNGHDAYLGHKRDGVWDADSAVNTAKLVHFSDYPLPKPWLATEEQVQAAKPYCDFYADLGKECRGQAIWLELYNRFKHKRNVSYLALLIPVSLLRFSLGTSASLPGLIGLDRTFAAELESDGAMVQLMSAWAFVVS